MLTPHDYQQALAVQDACNLSGVVFAFADVMRKICDEASAHGHGTGWRNQHPIAVLYASKIESLTRGDFQFSTAYRIVAGEAQGAPA